MPGKQATIQQYRLYIGYRTMGKSQEQASAKADVSLSTGKRFDKFGPPLPQSRVYRTRVDPLQGVWVEVLQPLLEEKPQLSPTTLLDYLQNKYPGDYPDAILRTLQRRVKHWKATSGPNKEIYFEQEHKPGLLGMSDFTEFKGTTITINGEPFIHKLYHFRLSYSGWSYIKAICGGESFTALAENFQSALWRLGGSPLEHRTDSLSAAYKNLDKVTKRDVTKLYSELCVHYNIKPTRNNLGKKHENGSIESSHRHMKRRLEQALVLRGSLDFNSLESYQSFIDEVVQNYNRNNSALIKHERKFLQPLPQTRTCDYTTTTARVASTSTIKVRNHVFSVPSRLIGENIKIHIYDNRFECYLGTEHLFNFSRVGHKLAKVRKFINYRHLLPSLVKKPGAFGQSTIKYDILPTETYKEIWLYLEKKCERQQACKIIVSILQLAHETNKEYEIGAYVKEIISQDNIPYTSLIQKEFKNQTVDNNIINIEVKQHDLRSYNELLETKGGLNASDC